MTNRRFLLGLLLGSVAVAAARDGLLLEHDYDPLGDKVVSLRIVAGGSAGQSFVLPPGGAAPVALRMKVMRAGSPGALTYRVGTNPGAADIAEGSLPAEAVTPYFETFVTLDLHGGQIPRGRKSYVRLSQAAGGSGHYEVYGTTTEGKEGPINLDYGAVTRSYAGGEAYDESGQPSANVDLAFQLVTAAYPGKVEEPFAFLRDLVGPLRYRKARALNARPAAGEIRIDNTWHVQPPAGASLVVRTAVGEFERFLAGEMNVKPTGHGKAIVLRIGREGLSKPEAFRLDVRADQIIVTGYDDRALMRGLYYLQDVMDLRQAPLLKAGVVTRSPRYSPRISCAPMNAGEELKPASDPYTDGLLARMSHAGFNAIYVWAKLHELGRSAALPELAPEAESKLARLNGIVDRASKYGIDVYLYVTLDPLPEAFFDKHPDARGVPRQFNSFYGAGYVLCTSAPVVQRYIRE
ncbi:MAG: hypothetical protein NTY38_24135, partial [Acidobacteria bacterium]|nr:hypothetical protein [Acidobacteriota bacterium]